MPADLPFQINQNVVASAPVVYNPFAAAATAEIFESGRPPPKHCPRYEVRIDKKINKDGKSLITEFTILDNFGDVSASPVGTQSSSVQTITNKESPSYIAQQTLAELGFRTDDPRAAGVRAYIPAIIMAETTGAPQVGPDGQPVAPGALVGRTCYLAVVENRDRVTGELKLSKGKYYPKLYWSPKD
jgi:hypothetical protein